ncbi:phage tail tape measure protein [Lactobacillaceae bacterium 24-114]
MAEIEGYTFAIDMEDRGVMRKFQDIKREATAMKNVMKSTFNELKAGEGTFSSLNYKIQETDRVIDAYKLAISRAQESMKKLRQEEQENGKMSDESARKYLRLGNTVASFQRQIGKLKIDQEAARNELLRYNSGLDQLRAHTQSVKSVMSNYVAELESEGRAFASTRAKQQSYAMQKQSLTNQYRAEVSETSRLRSQLTELDSKYSQQKTKVAATLAEHGKLSQEYQEERGKLEGLSEKITETNGKFAKQSSAALKTRTSINEMSRAAASVSDGGISRLSRAMNNVSSNAARATSHTREWVQSMRGGFMAASVALVPFGMAIGKSVQMSSELQAQWVTTKNLLVTGGEKVSDVTKTIGEMQRDASKYSREYGYSQKEIADQYTELVKRGYTSEAALGSMKSMLEAARASGDDFNDVVESSSQVLDAFGLQGKNAAQQMKNTNRVVNSMAYSADMTATSFKNLGLAMSYVSASASQAGFSVEETSAAIGILSNSGVEASKAGTGLRKVINSILAPTQNAQAALKGVGLSIDDFKKKDGSLKSMSDIFKQINEHTKDLGKADKGAFFKALFGTTGQQAGTILAQSMDSMAKGNKNLEELTKNVEKAEKGNGYVHQLATKNMQSTQMEMKKLQMNIQDMAINLGNKLLPAVNDVAEAMSDWVGSKEGQKVLNDFSDAVSGLARTVSKHSGAILSFTGGLATGFLDIFKYGGKAVSVIGNVTSAIFKLPGMKGNGKTVAKFIGETTGAILGFITAFKILKKAVNGISAIRQDIRGIFKLDGVSKEQSQLEVENNELKENIDLWKRHNQVANGGSSLGGGTVTTGEGKSQNKATTEVTATVEKGSAQKMENAGRKSAGFFSHGFGKGLKTVGRFGADILIQTFTLGILDWDTSKLIVSKLLTPFKALGRAIKKIDYFPDGRVASVKGAKAGSDYAKGIEKGAKQQKKIKFNDWFKSSSKSASKEGQKTGKSFTKGVTESTNKSSTKVSTKSLFSNAAKEAAEAGTKSSKGFIGTLEKGLSRTKTVGDIGKSLGGRLGGAAAIAFGAVDLFKAVGSSDNHNRARKVGQSLGTTVGGAGGAAIGASLGSVIPGIGTLIGGLLGGTIGSVAGGKIGKSIGKAWPQIKKGASETAKFIGNAFEAPFKWAYSQGQKFGNWLNKQLGRKKKTDNTIGAGNYSAKDRRLVQQMTSAVKSYTKALERLKKTKMNSYFKQMANEIKKSKITKELQTLDKNTKNSARNWRALAKPLKDSANAFKVLQKSVRDLSGKKSGFTQLSRDVQNLYRTIRKNPFGKLIAQQADIANKSMSGKKSGFVTVFNRNVQLMNRALRSFKRTFDRDWKSVWSGLDRPVSRSMSAASRYLDRYLDDMLSTRSKFSNSFIKGWNNWIDDVVSNFRKGFSKLPGYAQSSMKDIISRLNKGISGINSTISSFGGDKKLSTISYAEGTKGGHPGGHMLVNDSVRPHWKELVIFPNGQAMVPQHRNTLIPNAPQGTQVLSGENTYKFMNTIGVHKYANGTLSDSEMEKLSEEFEKNPQQASKKLVLKFTNWDSKTPVIANFGKASAIAFSRGIANVLKDQMADMANPPGSGVARWRPAVLRALSMLGLSSSLVDKVLRQIDTESKGDPHAHQPGTDPDGDGSGPALGLMQTKRKTFDSYAVGNHRNLWNGFDNILAGLNYAMHRYGKGLSALGNGHGYANGGFVGVHGLYEVAEGDKLESIIPMDINKRPRALDLVNQTLDRMEQDGGGTGNIKRSNPIADDKFQNNVISLLGQIAGLSQQQIQAILSINNNRQDSLRDRSNRARFYRDYGNDQHLADYQSMRR